jgi:hypothetical protein
MPLWRRGGACAESRRYVRKRESERERERERGVALAAEQACGIVHEMLCAHVRTHRHVHAGAGTQRGRCTELRSDGTDHRLSEHANTIGVRRRSGVPEQPHRAIGGENSSGPFGRTTAAPRDVEPRAVESNLRARSVGRWSACVARGHMRVRTDAGVHRTRASTQIIIQMRGGAHRFESHACTFSTPRAATETAGRWGREEGTRRCGACMLRSSKQDVKRQKGVEKGKKGLVVKI